MYSFDTNFASFKQLIVEWFTMVVEAGLFGRKLRRLRMGIKGIIYESLLSLKTRCLLLTYEQKHGFRSIQRIDIPTVESQAGPNDSSRRRWATQPRRLACMQARSQ